ncbi:histone-lysine N-methyltransferase ATXR2 isoform X1 [Elaeis guineensis]|uniref:Histone-lysine N-methyltransferase ATXR2 isoform X1 n=2 Tax=Elaeis guineensis var. tenera TaxID=51953 RepID=A0A6I9QCA9_ELAGV|nr:histone-lysine N-methyltransferase ATXR2 isoform X1 [Elaeis guineensis]XP_029117180.1 histone-lysine N-methyltransferase ATXR2 isoform X1 [Elaeis guineensis]XP_029117181.1 histone-lysine N-methyltransferase ATXR2 isoform X1 [Elaeis guineensis]
MDGSPCPLDKEFSDRIAVLLAPPTPQSIQEYYDKLIEATNCHGLRIKYSNKHGKGVYANSEFKEGELILKDQMLVAAQHSSNKVDCLVCSYCFRFIGSIELQIGRKLYLQGLGLSTKKECDYQTFSHSSNGFCQNEMEEAEGNFFMNESDNTGSSSSKNLKADPLPEDLLLSLMNGDLSLPYTRQFALPPVIACPGGCEEEHYCSNLCADSDWESFHSLLCTGQNTERSRRASLFKFIEHANSTNDIFILAAKVISYTILKCRKLKRSHTTEIGKQPSLDKTDEFSFSLLMEAWKPISMGFKKRWWDCIALPDDVDSGDEESFRMQIRDLAFTSLKLLKEAIFDDECAPLFSLEIYGHIIGMFELNNLDLVVASPVEDYFIYIDDLPCKEKHEAETVARPFLDALGDEYAVCCQGTAFFPLQSCMNHSCCPNAKAFKRDEDRDGHAVIVALRPISIGEEITISYIDEDLPYDERQVQLADYGFRCRCARCLQEQS